MRDGCQTAPKLSVTQLHLFGEAGSDSQRFNFDTGQKVGRNLPETSPIAAHVFYDTFVITEIATHVFYDTFVALK